MKYTNSTLKFDKKKGEHEGVLILKELWLSTKHVTPRVETQVSKVTPRLTFDTTSPLCH